MVLVAQSSINEDSQSRQLRVSKKLSKAISSVPRSRFQKPRPNLPGLKRIESNVPPVRRANETSQNTDTTKAENSNLNESPQKSFSLRSSVTLNTEDISTSYEITNKSEISCIDEVSQNDGVQQLIENLSTDEISQNNDVVKLSDDDIIEKSQNSEDLKNSSNTVETTSNNPAEISGNLNALTDETSQSSDTANSLSTNNESVQELSVEKVPTLEVPDTIDIPPITTPNNNDKSFKYPHLTSILSKKRAEPKKEVQHKKRKKFKKGDAAPERSKMTMADLIYWNPTNTEQPSKSADTEHEIPTNSNVDDPEENPDADIPVAVEDNNICDSVPKLVISEDGSINIDQSSLVVSRNIAEPTITEVIQKDDTTYSSYRKRPMTKHWTAKDTTIFYKALSLVGTDFGLMEKIFPHRTRRELKLKFKREEKFNIDLINRAMYESHLTFDANTLGDLIKNLNDLTGDFSTENGQEDSQAPNKEKKKSTNRKRKITKVAKPVDHDVNDVVTESVLSDVASANDDEVKTKRRRKAKKLPEDFIDIDDIEEIVLQEEEESEETNSNDDVCEVNSTEITSEEKLNKSGMPQPETPVPSCNDFCDATNIEILCIDDVTDVDFRKQMSGLGGSETVFVSENASDISEVIATQDNGCENPSQTTSSTRDNEQEQCITLEYVDVSESGDLSLLNNVMAFEVVASNTPIPKRRRKVNFTPKLPNKDMLKKSCQPIKLSSTNYTPV